MSVSTATVVLRFPERWMSVAEAIEPVVMR